MAPTRAMTPGSFWLETPLGPLCAAFDGLGRLNRMTFVDRASLNLELVGSTPLPPTYVYLQRQLEGYFQGACQTFNVPMALDGSPFQLRVWQALMSIPHGRTLSYGALATQLGGSTLTRAVGHALGQNPIAILVPCHRVVGADGSLTGYAGGLDRKRALLALEHGELVNPLLDVAD